MKPVKLLVFIAIGGALLSGGCIGGMYAVAGATDSGSTEIITREIAWDGSETLVAALPSTTRYIQAPGPGKIVARGPHRSVSTLAVTNGRIHDKLFHTGAMIELTVTAPNVKAFHAEGASKLTIENFDQDSLQLSTTGEAQITAAGRAREISVSLQGSAVANLARVSAESLSGQIGGWTTAIGAPTQTADLHIGGSGAVILLTRPPQLDIDITEDGRLIDASPS
jgi:hypothetical protein